LLFVLPIPPLRSSDIGQSLSAQAENGQEVNVVVTEINEDHVVIDGNHPLAGKELVFDIEVLEIENLTNI